MVHHRIFLFTFDLDLEVKVTLNIVLGSGFHEIVSINLNVMWPMHLQSLNYVLVPADKAANNAVVAWGFIKHELFDTEAYELQASLSERSLLMGMVVIQPYILVWS